MYTRGLLPEVAGRLRAVPTALLTALLLIVIAVPSITRAVDPPQLDTFMAALGRVESNGRYEAVNSSSGALGKYQIMPANWRAWSSRYLGDPNAEPTPENQEVVARAKLTALYRWLGDWGSVAHWWLTGDGDTDPAHWSDFSRRYVNKVLAAMGQPGLPSRPVIRVNAAPAVPGLARQVVDESSRDVHFSGGWGEVAFARYAGGKARYAVDGGATAWFSFTGKSISWVGPLGPTRGQAKIYIDEELVATVDDYARSFHARANIFSKTFDRVGTHTITIEVVGTPGRETIALDEFVVNG